MPELRKDPITGRWVIIATDRAKRPTDFVREKVEIHGSGFCPFCSGNEAKTPPEILAYRKDGSPRDAPGWSLRVVSNKFPALGIEGELSREAVGMFDKVNGIGAHEVIIETPDHHRTVADMTPEEIVPIFKAWRERLNDLRRDIRIRYVLLFKNHGREAGASLFHPHSQLIATPIIPTTLVEELNVAREHFSHKERCVFCDLIRQERSLGDRVALETDRFVLLEPFASSFPFETWLLPKDHSHDFALCSDQMLEDLARLVRDFLRRIRKLLDDPPYNFILHTAPSPHPRPGQPRYWTTIEYDYHWHLEFIPRITRIAGFEWGSGYSINPTPPEEAARFLREVTVGEDT